MKFLKWLYAKIIGDDIDTIKYVIKQSKEGKPILDPEKKKIFVREFKRAPITLFKESWYWILAVIFCFAMGSLIGFEYCEMKCNEFIYENFEPEPSIKLPNETGGFVLPVISPSVSVLDSDVGEPDGYG